MRIKFLTVCFFMVGFAASKASAFQPICDLSVTVEGCVVIPPPLSGDEFGGQENLVTNNSTECVTELPLPAPPPHCQGEVKALQLRYTGGGCEMTSYTQNEKKVNCTSIEPWQYQRGAADLDKSGNINLVDFSIFSQYWSDDSGAVNFADLAVLAEYWLESGFVATEPVRVVAFSARNEKNIWLDTDQAYVYPDEIIELTAANAGVDELGQETVIEVFNENEELIEQVSFYTSCSQPLNLGDRFGSFEVFGMDTTEGGISSLGAEVIYTYNVTNNGPVTLNGVTVIDDYFGEVPGSPIESIGSGQTVTLMLTAVLSEETTNTVTVTGLYGDYIVCEAEATATITEAVPQAEACTTKISAMLLEYTGPAIAGAMVELFPTNRKFVDAPVVYEDIDLLPGVVLSLPQENGMTIDSATHNASDLGPNISIIINGTEEVIHTSCSAPVEAGYPAPLNNSNGALSTNWLVIDFEQK